MFFLCGFSNILKSTSRWLTKSIKAQLDPNKSTRGVMDAFEDQISLMRKANAVNCFPTPTPNVRIRNQNFLEWEEPDCRADLIVTSPPYVTSYDYADIHQLSTLWLRYESDYRDLRKNMIGNQYGIKPPDLTSISDLGSAAHRTYEDLLQQDPRKAYSVARYFIDINKAVRQVFSNADRGWLGGFRHWKYPVSRRQDRQREPFG